MFAHGEHVPSVTNHPTTPIHLCRRLNLSNKSASEVDVSPWERTKRVCHPHTGGKVMSRAYECAIVGRHSRHIHQVIKDLLKMSLRMSLRSRIAVWNWRLIRKNTKHPGLGVGPLEQVCVHHVPSNHPPPICTTLVSVQHSSSCTTR